MVALQFANIQQQDLYRVKELQKLISDEFQRQDKLAEHTNE